MDCLELRKSLLLFVDRELSTEEAREVRLHLDGCPPCRRRAEYEERFQAMLRERLAPRPAPSGLRDKICARLAEELPARRAWGLGGSLPFPPVLAAGLAMLLILVLVSAFAAQWISWEKTGSGSHVRLRGQLVCIRCEKGGVPVAYQRNCKAFRHETGLKTRDGRILSFADTEAVAPLLADPSLRGREVELEGSLYPHIATVEVARYTLQ